jgi:vacuolar-type H+-ATPase subunit H
MKLSIEEVRNLIRLEKEGDQKLEQAKEQADRIIAKAKENASKIVSTAGNQEYYDQLLKTWMKKTDTQKKAIEEQTEKRIKRLREAAQTSAMENAVSIIVKHVLGE